MHLSSFSLILLSYWLLATNCFNFKLPASSKYRFFQSTLSPSSKRLSISNNQPLRSSKGSIIAPDVGNRTDYRSDADYIRDSIVCWLNTEFIDLECHYKIGDRVRDAYLRLRESGITDAGEMMLEIGTSLEVGKVDFDKAFVGPWDVANRASDIIFELLDVEACACSAPRSGNTPDSSIVQITSDCRVTRAEILPQKMQSLTSDFHSSMFIRYNFLKRFLEGM